jgi:competence/damage-inducible protein CinA-like protein
MLTAEIIAIGSELLTPRFQDTNSLFLTEHLNAIGIPVVMRTVAGDSYRHLEHALRAATERTPLVLTIGGLGPTEDDITRKVVSQVSGRRLVLDDATLEKIGERFRARGRTMPSNNARQALIPEGGEILENPNGTAPGVWLETVKAILILLPGPPSELRPMFERLCLDRLAEMAGGLALERRLYRTTGLPESSLDARIAPIYTRYKNPETTILAKPGQVDVRLTARGQTADEARALLEELGRQIEEELAQWIFTTAEQQLEEVVGMYLVMKRATIATAESCTGGLVAERLTRIPGSSRYFQSGMVTYSNASKIDLAGIPPLLLEMEGAVSREVAVGLAEGVREKVGTTLGVGITGIAGPNGGTAEKPVGTVHIAVAGPSGTDHSQFVFPGARDRVRWQASQAALDMVRRLLERM